METYLRTQDSVWPAAIRELCPRIHPVDRAAVRIWFSFFPLAFHEIVEREGGHKDFLAVYQARGMYRLRDQVDSSHSFLYGHRFWPDVKRALLSADVGGGRLVDVIGSVAAAVDGPSDLTLGMAAVGLMTLRQVGAGAFGGTPAVQARREKPDQVLAARAADKKSWLRPAQPRVIFREDDPEGWFAVRPGQELTTAAEQDKRPYHLRDSRCFENMGPIPVECRSGKCGTCWVGVLGGNENLSPMAEWERKRLAHFGYFDPGFESLADERPLIRLACQAQAAGSVSIVIPPWCGVRGEGGVSRRSDMPPSKR